MVCNPAQSNCVLPSPECIPKTACDAGRVCGTQANGCGGYVTCGAGDCPGGQVCSSDGQCLAPVQPCVPKSFCSNGKVCGVEDDG